MGIPADNIVTNIEYRYDVKAIESNVQGLWYLYDDDRKELGLLRIKKG